MFLLISTGLNPTLEIPLSSILFYFISIKCFTLVGLRTLTNNLINCLLYSLRPIISNKTCPFRITAAAGTKFAGASFSSNVIIFLDERVLQPKSCHHSRCIAGSSFRSLSNIPHCCLLMESGPYLSPSVADHPLRPAKDLRLGALLPHQLPNPTWAYLITT